MRKSLLCLLCLLTIGASAHARGRQSWPISWTLHCAGPHSPTGNTCDLAVVNCWGGEIDVNAPAEPGRYDVYVIATSIAALGTTQFGLYCDGDFGFYGWTSCGDSYVPSAGWPGCAESVSIIWNTSQPGPNVTLGIIDVYSYGGSSNQLCAGPVAGLGYAEVCDGSGAEAVCQQLSDVWRFGCVGFGVSGYNSCEPDPVESTSWGAIKSLYR